MDRTAPAGLDVPLPSWWLSAARSVSSSSGDPDEFGASQREEDGRVSVSAQDHDAVHGGSCGSSASHASQHVTHEKPILRTQGARQEEKEEREAEARQHNADGGIPAQLPDSSTPVTTMMVRNLSRQLLQEHAMRQWPCGVYNYNMFYAVYDLKQERGSGLIYINFVTHESAVAFQKRWRGHTSRRISRVDRNNHIRPLLVDPAPRQGWQVNFDYWRHNLRLDADPSLAPVIFINGQRREFWQYVRSMPAVPSEDHLGPGVVFL